MTFYDFLGLAGATLPATLSIFRRSMSNAHHEQHDIVEKKKFLYWKFSDIFEYFT